MRRDTLKQAEKYLGEPSFLSKETSRAVGALDSTGAISGRSTRWGSWANCSNSIASESFLVAWLPFDMLNRCQVRRRAPIDQSCKTDRAIWICHEMPCLADCFT